MGIFSHALILLTMHPFIERLQNISIKQKSIKKIQEAYELDVYTIEEYKERKAEVTKEIEQLEDEKKILELRLKYMDDSINQQRLLKINQFRKLINKKHLSSEKINDAYKSIIESIIWTRSEDNIDIKINFR